MTFEQLVEIINDSSKTAYQKAADLHALLNQSPPPAKTIKSRKSRGPNKPKPLLLSNGAENQDVN